MGNGFKIGNIIAVGIALLSLLLNDDSVFCAQIIGLGALFYSIMVIRVVRGHSLPVILFSIILYVNLSVYVLGPLTYGLTFNEYQWLLWGSKYNTIGMKNMLITSCMFYVAFNKTNLRNQRSKSEILLSKKDNAVISILCLGFVVLVSLYGFSGSVGDTYESNSNALFEYCILFMVLAWYYGSKKMMIKIFWFSVCLFYIGIALSAGDRSSAFMLIIVIALYYFKYTKIGIIRILVLCLLGIITSNFIELYRTTGISSNSPLTLMSRGLQGIFSNTAAQSGYTGITIYYYIDRIQDAEMLFFKWIVSIFTGSAYIDRSTIELSTLATIYNYNGGGGMFFPYFYLFYRYLGVFIGSFFVGYILRKIFFEWKGDFVLLLSYLVIAMSLRWYLYTPTTLFRTCFVNFGILYIVAKLFNTVFDTKSTNYGFVKKQRNP